MPPAPSDAWPTSWRDLVAGILGAVVVCAIVWSAIADGSAASQTALVGALGAVTGWAFRGAVSTPPNGTNGTNGAGTPTPSGTGNP